MSTPIGDLNMNLFAISNTNWQSRIISHKADADLVKRIYICPELTLACVRNAFFGEDRKDITNAIKLNWRKVS